MSRFIQVIGAAAVGYVAGILMAPKSGKETRAELAEKAERMREVATDKATEMKEVYDEGAKKVRMGASIVGAEATELAKQAKDSASNVKREVGAIVK